MPPFPSDPVRDRDPETVRLMQAGDGDGLRRLLDDHGSRIRWWLRREFTTLGDQDLDEVFNLAALRAWEAADRFDPRKGTLRAWFYVIVRRCALSVLRRERRARRARLVDWDRAPVWSEDAAPAEGMSQPGAFVTDLQGCIEKLPRLQKAIIEADLRAGELADAKQLAQDHDTSTNSIYVSRSYARRSLLRCLEGKGHRVDPAPTEGKKEP